MVRIDAVLREDRWHPRFGWHDDHRARDRTPEYLPAMQQVRAEFAALVASLEGRGICGGRCLQLGMGECDASHAVWRALFGRVVTLDFRVLADQDVKVDGGDIHKPSIAGFAGLRQPYDMLFIDAGHTFEDVERDHEIYAPMVRRGGVIAFHDALKRPGFEDEVHVWRYLETLSRINMIGTEVGIAWTVKA